jgi:uncharacterized membrane protein YgdD (TMEM256/DUF423 family)
MLRPVNHLRVFWVMGALLGFLGVLCGAFGAHGLKGYLGGLEPDLLARRLGNWETASRYAMYHALALLLTVTLAPRAKPNETPLPAGAAVVAGYSFILGTLVFSGSLYLLVLSGRTWLGAITPIGGVLFLVGWIALALASKPRARS